MWNTIITIAVCVFGFIMLLGMIGGAGNRDNVGDIRRNKKGIWSGDTRNEEARRNTRTDSNFRGYDHWNNNQSDKGW